jgi:DNA-binding transcriptional ArsR family regulator
MSVEAQKWAMDAGEEHHLEPTRRYVLLLLGNLADHRGGNLYPSHAYIAKRTGLSKSTVRRHIDGLEQAGILARTPGVRLKDGSQTSNLYQLAMAQPGLGLEDTTPPMPTMSTGGAHGRAPPLSIAMSTREVGVEVGELRKAAGQGKPSPVAHLFKDYQDGIARLYGAEYPRSAKANGQLALVLKLLGAERAGQALAYYLGSAKPYYATRKHALDVFVRDAADLCVAMQQAAGGPRAAAPTRAGAYLEIEGEDAPVRMADYPLGEPLDIAKQFAREFASRVNRPGVRVVMIRIGARETRFKQEELR